MSVCGQVFEWAPIFSSPGQVPGENGWIVMGTTALQRETARAPQSLSSIWAPTPLWGLHPQDFNYLPKGPTSE